MKVRLDGYFKAGGVIHPKGTVFDSTQDGYPNWVQDLVDEGSLKITVLKENKVELDHTLSESEESEAEGDSDPSKQVKSKSVKLKSVKLKSASKLKRKAGDK